MSNVEFDGNVDSLLATMGLQEELALVADDNWG